MEHHFVRAGKMNDAVKSEYDYVLRLRGQGLANNVLQAKGTYGYDLSTIIVRLFWNGTNPLLPVPKPDSYCIGLRSVVRVTSALPPLCRSPLHSSQMSGAALLKAIGPTPIHRGSSAAGVFSK